MVGLFNLLIIVVRRDIVTFDLIVEKHPSIYNILRKGILLSENYFIR
jgi:hypothetical protein